MNEIDLSDREKLFSPWVMRSAWRKIKRWYKRPVNLADPGEILSWKSDPWFHLSELSKELKDDAYSPSVMPQIPYPKSKKRTRHFVMPSVKDQVAFTVYVTLLGPFFEAKMPNVSFGNRLFRPRVKFDSNYGDDSESVRKKWFRGPYSLRHSKLFESFSTGYGLYRRLLEWISNECILKEDTKLKDIEEYNLPYIDFLREKKIMKDKAEMFYAKLDFKLAYPSLKREKLDGFLSKFVDEDFGDFKFNNLNWGCAQFPSLKNHPNEQEHFEDSIEQGRKFTREHPWKVLSRDDELRKQIATEFERAFLEIEYAGWNSPWGSSDIYDPDQFAEVLRTSKDQDELKEDFRELADSYGVWPTDSPLQKQEIDTDQFGLPTGLAISGVLQNIALAKLDHYFCREFVSSLQTDPFQGSFYLRFSDDLVLLSTDKQKFLNDLNKIKEYGEEWGLSLNVKKTKPESAKKIIQNIDSDKNPSDITFQDEDKLTRSNVPKFTTNVVREMSDLKTEEIDQKFGPPGIDRLENLLDLAERDDEDEEVEQGTRKSFAINKLARAKWPNKKIKKGSQIFPPQKYVYKILTTAEKSIRNDLSRFKLWKPILVIALRSEIFEIEKIDNESNDYNFGKDWIIKNLLKIIRCSVESEGKISDRSWEANNIAEMKQNLKELTAENDFLANIDEKYIDKLIQRRTKNSRLRTSFHRSVFWRHYSDCFRLTNLIAEGELNDSVDYWPSKISQDQAKKLIDEFFDLSDFLNVVYGDWQSDYWPEGEPFFWWWEAEGLLSCLMKTHPPDKNFCEELGGLGGQKLRKEINVEYFLNSLELTQTTRHTLQTGFEDIYQYRSYENQIKGEKNQGTQTLWCTITDLTTIDSDDGKVGDQSKNSIERFFPDFSYKSRFDTKLWTSFARLLSFQHFDSIRDLENYTFPPPPDYDYPNKLWKNITKLDSFYHLRKLLLSHGAKLSGSQIYWNKLDQWFPDIFESGNQNTNTDKSYLDINFGTLSKEKNFSPGKIPALQLNEDITDKFIHFLERLNIKRESLDANKDNGSLVTPSNIILLSDELVDSWEQVRKKQTFEITKDMTNKYSPESVREAEEELFNSLLELLAKIKSEESKIGIRDVVELNDDGAYFHDHPLFLYPKLILESSASPEWEKSLVQLLLIDGSESLLDYLYYDAPWHFPLFQRREVRSRLLMDDQKWTRILRGLGTRHEIFEDYLVDRLEYMFNDAKNESENKTSDGLWRKKIYFLANGNWTTLSHFHEKYNSNIALNDTFNVLLAQPKKSPNYANFLKPNSCNEFVESHDALGELEKEISEILYSAREEAREYDSTDDDIDLLLFPEWYMPNKFIPKLRSFVRDTGIAIMAGLLPKKIRSMVDTNPVLEKNSPKFFCNEAVLILPELYDTDGPLNPTDVDTFYLRKPVPSNIEAGLARFMSEKTGDDWYFAGDNVWPLFVHPIWGNFTGAICSDILNSSMWDWYSGKLQHLLVAAFNKDIELFDQFTWTRGYELYCNVITSNHGECGGSVAWSPKTGHQKEIFSTHGRDISLTVLLNLPLTSLKYAQENMLEKKRKSEKERWHQLTGGDSKSDEEIDFKSPPPDFNLDQ